MRTAKEALEASIRAAAKNAKELETRAAVIVEKLLEKGEEKVEEATERGVQTAFITPVQMLEPFDVQEIESAELRQEVWLQLKSRLEKLGYQVPHFICGGQVKFYWTQEAIDSRTGMSEL